MGDGDNHGRSSATIIVEDTPEVVYEWVSAPSHSTRWVKGLTRSKQVTKGDLKVGSIIRETIKVPNATAEITGKILELEPNKKIATQYYVSGMKLKRGEMVPIKRGDYANKRFVSEITLERIGAYKTKVHYTIEAEYTRWYTRLLEPLVTSDTGDNMAESLKTLKEKVKKSRESRAQKMREKKERLKKKEAKKKKKKQMLKIDKKKSLQESKPFDTTGLIIEPKLKPLMKLNPKMDIK